MELTDPNLSKYIVSFLPFAPSDLRGVAASPAEDKRVFCHGTISITLFSHVRQAFC